MSLENVTIGDVISATGGEILNSEFDTSRLVESVTIDSRSVSQNALFVPIPGKNVDPHRFIQEALAKGAVASLSEVFVETQGIINGAVIRVKNTLEALQNLAKFYRKRFEILVIGITGSVGKSTTKEMLATIFNDGEKQVLKNNENLNGQIGLPLTLLNLGSQHKIAVLEMGVSKPGEMEKLAEIADPDIGVIGNIGVSHLEYFKTPENIFEEKVKLINKDSPKYDECRYYFNGDNPVIYRMTKKLGLVGENSVFFGINGDYKYLAQNISQTDSGTEFTVTKVVGDDTKFSDSVFIPTLGIHNVYNALAAISVALDAGVPINTIRERLKSYKQLDMRQQIIPLKNGVTLVDDSYNSSPDSIKSAVSVFKLINNANAGKNIVVLGDMLELGEASRDFHFEIGKYLALENIDILLLKGENSKQIESGFMSIAKEAPAMVCHYDKNEEIIEALRGLVSDNSKILVKGSRGMKMDEICEFLKSEFSQN